MEEGAARAAVGFGDLDPHDVEREEAVEERTRNLARLIHLTDERTNLPVREFVHAVVNQPFFVGERRKC